MKMEMKHNLKRNQAIETVRTKTDRAPQLKAGVRRWGRIMTQSYISPKPITNYVSGHLDLTVEEFNAHYRPAFDEALARGDSFVVGDARGTDSMTQNYLLGKTTAVVVYHMFTTPRNNAGFKTLGGFLSDEERDAQMTADSDQDIAWVRLGREKSGTQKNIDRRRQNSALQK